MDLPAPAIRRLLDHGDVALLVGSVAVGLAQDSSDLDIAVIASVPEAVWSELPGFVDLPGAGTSVELERFSISGVLAQRDVLRGVAGGLDEDLRHVRQEVLVRYSMLLTGQVVVDDTDRWPELLTLLESDLYQAVTRRWHEAWARHLAGLGGLAAAIGDVELLAVVTRAMAAHAFDAMLVERGEVYFSPKYRFERAARCGLDDEGVVDHLWRFHAVGSGDAGVALAAFHDACAWAAGLLCTTLDTDPVVPARRRDLQWFRTSTEWVLVRAGRAWVVAPPVVDLCEALTRPQALAAGQHDAVRDLVARDLLELPEKLGRWAMWI